MPKIKLRVKETVIYDQEIEVSQEQCDELLKLNGEDCIESYQEGYSVIDEVVNKQDVFDTTGSFEDVEVKKID